nr:uncharacterized protein LOC118682276 [Bactrocera oleae]
MTGQDKCLPIRVLNEFMTLIKLSRGVILGQCQDIEAVTWENDISREINAWTEELGANHQNKAKQLHPKHSFTFDKDDSKPERTKVVKNFINTGDAIPIRQASRSVSLPKRKVVSQIIRDISKSGIIEPSASQWSSPVPPVKAAKRQRSAEEAKPLAKRPKTKGVTPAKSFAEVARNRIVIGVLDEGDPEGRIPRAQWKWVQAALTNVALEVLLSNPDPPPSCTDAGWYQGQIKVIAGDDERSVALYNAAIAKVGEVYPGAKLVAVDQKGIPSRPRARVWIPATPSQPDQIMQLIRACNPSLPTEGWKYVKIFEDSVAESGVETKRATMQILLLLTKEPSYRWRKVAGR